MEAKYTGNVFKCFSDDVSLLSSVVNDDFRDCGDGSDEPGTAACTLIEQEQLFYCPNEKSAPEVGPMCLQCVRFRFLCEIEEYKVGTRGHTEQSHRLNLSCGIWDRTCHKRAEDCKFVPFRGSRRGCSLSMWALKSGGECCAML